MQKASARTGPVHLYWLYLFALVPLLSEIVESGGLPNGPRDWLTEGVMTAVVVAGATVLRRQAIRVFDATHAQLVAVEELRHAERLAVVGQLASGLAHELGTPLTVVEGRAKMIASGEVSGAELTDSARVIVDQAKKMAALVRELLDFSRRRTARPERLDAGELAEAVVHLLRPMAQRKRARLTLERSGRQEIRVDPMQVQQALANLVVNAIHSVGAGGQVTVSVGRETVREREWVCLRVRDDGAGLTPEVRARLFEPFFTTKAPNEGTGLGLSVGNGLVRDNGGWISAESPASGASFAIFFEAA